MNTKRITLSLITMLVLCFITSCKKDEVLDTLPTLTTEIKVSNYKFVTIQGYITPTAGKKVTERGVCWSKYPAPTVDSMKIVSGAGVGVFTTNIVGLDADSTYYVRAYAKNSAGTVYGNQVVLRAPVMIRFNPKVSYDTLTDIDGNKYRIDTIGTKIWMCENLRVTKYKDGSPILSKPAAADWMSATEGAYCVYNNNSIDVNKNGLLYNWFAANNPLLAPDGWRVATAADWAELSTFLGGNILAGGKLKEAGVDNWMYTSSSFVGSNSSGFTAVPGGYRSSVNGTYYYVGQNGFWWTATEVDAVKATYRGLNYNNQTLDINSLNKVYGLSIRLVKDIQ